MKQIGKYTISGNTLKFDFGTSTGWVFPFSDNERFDINKFGIDLRWRMMVMAQDINNYHKTNLNRHKIQNMINEIVIMEDVNSGCIGVNDNGNIILLD